MLKQISFEVPPPSRRVHRGPLRGGDHAAHEGHRGHAHHQPHRARSCRCATIVRWRGRRASRCSWTARMPSPTSRSRATQLDVRLLRHEPAQVAAARRSAPASCTCARRPDQAALAADGGSTEENGREHPEVRGDRHASRTRTTTPITVALAFHRAHRRRPQDRAAALPPRPLGQAPAQASSDRVKVLTPLDSHDSAGAIGFVHHRRARPGASCGGWLLNQHSIVTTPIVHPSSAASASRPTSTRPPRRSTPSRPRS